MLDVVLASGGTGGHLVPALALFRDLEISGVQVKICGIGLGRVKTLEGEAEKLIDLEMGKSPKSGKGKLIHLMKTTVRARRVLKSSKPKVVVGFGGLASMPTLLAAVSLRIPILLFEPNRVHGRVNRLLGKVSKGCFVPFHSQDLQPIGCKFIPVKPPILNHEKFSKEEARERLGLRKDKLTIVVFGGSQGAESLNRQIPKGMNSESQILHICGKKEHLEDVQNAYITAGVHAVVLEYLTDFHLAWSAADLAICRAGALSILESIHHHVPTILIPLESSKDNHQFHNAKWAGEVVGGSHMIEEKEFSLEQLHTLIEKIDFEKLRKKMSEHIKNQPTDEMRTYLMDNYIGENL